MLRFIFALLFTVGIVNGASDDQNLIIDEILKEEKYYNILLKKVKDTDRNIKENKERLSRSKETLEELDTTANILNNTKQGLEREIVKLVSKKYAITAAVKQEYKTTEQNTINRELFKVILKNAKGQISKLNSDYDTITKLISKNKEKALNLYTNIDELEEKKKKFQKQKEQQKILLKALKKKREELAKKEEDETKVIEKITMPKVEKVTSPLKSYTIVRNFGTYFDEERKMEMFNEALFLRSKTKNAKVYNILEGKIVYVKKNSSILGNVVIVKNDDNIYTIYAHMNRIFKSIRSGKKIKAGTAIGRVDRVLKFKVTKNTTYIDPLLIIKSQ